MLGLLGRIVWTLCLLEIYGHMPHVEGDLVDLERTLAAARIDRPYRRTSRASVLRPIPSRFAASVLFPSLAVTTASA